LKNLSDELLIEAYLKALELQLNDHFIELLKEELQKRGITHIQNNKESI
jgi:developmental checkpoint coupling sporulation initiation to replication initiation